MSSSSTTSSASSDDSDNEPSDDDNEEEEQEAEPTTKMSPYHVKNYFNSTMGGKDLRVPFGMAIGCHTRNLPDESTIDSNENEKKETLYLVHATTTSTKYLR